MLRTIVWFGLAGILLCAVPRDAAAVDFVQAYERGKVMLRQKLYFDAVKDFTRAIGTTRGARHFGAHYYLARAYFWLPDIQKSSKYLAEAYKLTKNKAQKGAVLGLKRRIMTLYGKLKLNLEVDPEEIGRLKVVLKPKSAFSHKHKKRFFSIVAKRLKRDGWLLNSHTLYLPRGDYDLSIAKPQCLSYGLTQNGKLSRNLSIADQAVSFTLKAQRSCECTGGQKMKKDGDRLFCACPSGMGWNKNKERCETGSNPWPWIIAGVGVVVVGTVTTIVLVTLPDGTEYRAVKAAGQSGNDANTAKVWNSNKVNITP